MLENNFITIYDKLGSILLTCNSKIREISDIVITVDKEIKKL